MEMEKPFRFANNTAVCLSPDFILPEEKRPRLSDVSPMHSVPIIDLKASYDDECQNGLVQKLPPEERAIFFTNDHCEPVKIFNYYFKGDDQNKVTMWSETFTHPWHPTEDFTHYLPTNPPQYRYGQYKR
ncbi:hypothetical protein SESBI_32361 [Sesbania bispinosa]|nr:hypothetical protein SESBI_32361 [Sesbania bispinosa]